MPRFTPTIAGGLLLVLAAWAFWATVWRVELWRTNGRDLHPAPDAVEYSAAAEALLREGRYTIHVAGSLHPPRYPFGYPVLIAAARLLGVPFPDAAFAVNKALAAVLLALAAAVAWRAAGPLAAGSAALLLATCPMFVALARAPIAEVASGVLVLVAVAVLLPREGALRWAVLGAAALGAAVCFRLGNLLLAPMVAVAWWVRYRRGPSRWRAAAGLALAWGVAASPLFVYQALALGSPLATGYGYWLPDREAFAAFAPGELLDNLAHLWAETTNAEVEQRVAHVYALASYWNPQLVVLLLAAVWCARRRRGLRRLTAALAVYAAGMAFYFFHDGRMWWPVVLLGLVGAGVVLARVLAGALPRAWAWLLVPLALSQVLGVPGKDADRPELFALADLAALDCDAPRYLLARELSQRVAGAPALVLTDSEMPYLHAAVGAACRVLPLDARHGYRWGRARLAANATDVPAEIRSALARGEHIWVATAELSVRDLAPRIALPAGYRWVVVWQDPIRDRGIARVERRP